MLSHALQTPDVAIRAAAGRLRAALDRYYASQGSRDLIFIKIPKGGYKLEIVRASQPGAAHLAQGAHLRERLRKLRSQMGITTAALAAKAGVDRSTIRRIESRQRIPTAETVHRIARVLGISVDNLMRDALLPLSEKPPDPAPDFDIHFDPAFEPEEVKEILTALADYYRACGGAGFELDLEPQEVPVKEPVHV